MGVDTVSVVLVVKAVEKCVPLLLFIEASLDKNTSENQLAANLYDDSLVLF